MCACTHACVSLSVSLSVCLFSASVDGGGTGRDQEEGGGVWEARWHWRVDTEQAARESTVQGELGLSLSLSLSLTLSLTYNIYLSFPLSPSLSVG